LGGLIIVFKTQLMTILLNQFFNSVVVASRSIAMQVSDAINLVAYNFIVALRPQIIKDYSGGQKEQMLNLVFLGEKVIFFLLYIFMLPLAIEMPIILSIWLKEPPLYAVVFTRLMLLDVFIEAISYPLNSAIMTTEKLKLFMPFTGGIIILNLPISWIGLSFGAPAYFVMVVSICLKSIVLLCNLFFARMLVSLPIKKVFREFAIPAFLVMVLSVGIPLFLCTILQQSLMRLFVITIISMFSVCIFVYLILLNSMERKQITRFILNKIHKARR
jgi:O-antigen/teichoic acid export membrane protein